MIRAAAGFARRVRLAIGESNRRDVTDAHGIANARAHIARVVVKGTRTNARSRRRDARRPLVGRQRTGRLVNPKNVSFFDRAADPSSSHPHAHPVARQQYKLCKVNKKRLGDKGVPCVNLHDGRTIRYPDPLISEHDSVMVDIATNKITEFIKYDAGALVMLTGGRNAGRVGVITRREKHKGSFEVVHVKDASGHEFATRAGNVFVIGTGNKPMVSLPKGKGLRMSIVEELEKRKEK